MIDRLKLVEIDMVIEIINEIPILNDSERFFRNEVLRALKDITVIEVNIPHEYFEAERGN